jgi:hypothetical protein
MELRFPQQCPHQLVITAGPRIQPWAAKLFELTHPVRAIWWRPPRNQGSNLVRMLCQTESQAMISAV